MTDKELLEAAAKAAGIEYDFCRPELGGCKVRKGLTSGWWNPLKDDGDCARLEAVIETEIQWHEDGVQAGKRSNPISSFCFYADHKNDKNATHRAASVTFAAEIVSSHNA